MSRRPSPFASITALAQAALLVLAQLLDGSGAHRCPEHDAMLPAAVEVHGHAATHHDAAPGCNCLGASCGSLAAFEAAPAARPRSPSARSWTPLVVAGREAPHRSSHLLPFALGPPFLA
jgi:hypothetical protein